MKLTMLMIGVVLLFSPVHGAVLDCLGNECTVGGDLKFNFNGNPKDGKLNMCLRLDNGECGGCYTVVKEPCESGQCWEITSYKDAQKINTIVGIMGALIAMMLVVLITTMVLYIRASPIIFKKLAQNTDDETYVKPIVPERPSHSLKDEQLIQKDCHADDGYIQGNDPKLWQIKQMEMSKGFQGHVVA